MQNIVDPRQMILADPYEHVFSPVAYKRVRAGWQGLFRHVILELLPAEALARSFSDGLGRPTKELYSMAGLVGLSRIYDNRHWASDVFAGALLGTLTGRFICKQHQQEQLSFYPVSVNGIPGFKMVYSW